MRPQSAKNKGRRFQQKIRDFFLKLRPELKFDDVRSTSMGAPGEDILFSPRARDVFPYSVECKCVERLNIWEAIQQARENAGEYTPLVAFSKNNEQTWVAIPIEEFGRLYEIKNNGSIGDLSEFDKLLRGLQIWRESVAKKRNTDS